MKKIPLLTMKLPLMPAARGIIAINPEALMRKDGPQMKATLLPEKRKFP